MRGRHHLALAFADGFAAAFPPLRLFAVGQAETRRLVELAADDAACTSTDELVLAEALLSMSAAPAPAVALAAGGDVGDRIRRLISGRRPLPRWAARMGLVAAGTLLMLPFAVAAGPALAATTMNCCRPTTPTTGM